MSHDEDRLHSKKIKDLARNKMSAEKQFLTTDQGVRLTDTDNSLRPGARGPSLLEDFHLREKLTRFDHERIPERVVHARGSAAHGYFQVYESLADLTAAAFLQDPKRRTPVFVRFSTVAGARGSADTVRDVRGFATKFYTDEGNFDLVGNNIPVFFIQDGIKFPDLVHAVKPEPNHEMPTAASAHDTFWDFASLLPESTHMLLWVMSDRALPRSYRMMEGFGVHTFRLVNERGVSTFVKFHWKPLLGVHGLTWDEAQKIAGFDPDFHRRDLWETIDRGGVVEYELGLQIIDDATANTLGFDLLDPTKLVPEERVPVRRVGKMTLDRNPTNFFAETEQVAFCVANVVPGIDVTDDPLMQARLFSYLDTQLSRLGSPNFAELPINRPVSPVCNHQSDGAMRHTIGPHAANYHPNSVGNGCPMLSAASAGYVHFPEPVNGAKRRQRAETFGDHITQAAMFWASLQEPERRHVVAAFCFELGKVARVEIRERMVQILARVNGDLAQQVAQGIGVKSPVATDTPNNVKASPALSMISATPSAITTRKVACLAAPGLNVAGLKRMREALTKAGVIVEIVAPELGVIQEALTADKALAAAPAVLYDAVVIASVSPAGRQTLESHPATRPFILDAFTHAKPMVAVGMGAQLVRHTLNFIPDVAAVPGLLISDDDNGGDALIASFLAALAKHRHWERETIMQ